MRTIHSLSPLSQSILVSNLTSGRMGYSFRFQGVLLETIPASEKSLPVLEIIVDLAKVTTEKSIPVLLQRLPGCNNLSGNELIQESIKLLPSEEELLGGVIQQILMLERGTQTMETMLEKMHQKFFLCAKDDHIQLVEYVSLFNVWMITSKPIDLDYQLGGSMGSSLLLVTQ
ncbi:MAG: hypothetical protein K9M36_01605 [Candidatus Pacebacteria bacterium]|nr:hypothetical protein [Candidatus Paceibacterota bacterium]